MDGAVVLVGYGRGPALLVSCSSVHACMSQFTAECTAPGNPEGYDSPGCNSHCLASAESAQPYSPTEGAPTIVLPGFSLSAAVQPSSLELAPLLPVAVTGSQSAVASYTVASLAALPPPVGVPQVRILLALFSFYRHFVPNFVVVVTFQLWLRPCTPY